VLLVNPHETGEQGHACKYKLRQEAERVTASSGKQQPYRGSSHSFRTINLERGGVGNDETGTALFL